MKRTQFFAAALVAFGAATAHAEKELPPFPGVNIERFSLDPTGRDSLAVDTAELLPAGDTRVVIALQFADHPSVTRVGEEYASIRLDQRVIGNVLAAHAFTSWLQAEVHIPIIFAQGAPLVITDKGYAPVAATALGAPTVGLRAGLLRQADGAPVDLAASLNVGLPIGTPNAFARDAQLPLRPSASVGRNFGLFDVGGQVYARFRSQENFGSRNVSPSERDTVGHELGFAFAASAALSEKVRAEVGVLSDFALDVAGNSTQTFGAVRYRTSFGSQAFLLAGPAFGELVGTPTLRILAGVEMDFGEKYAFIFAPDDEDDDGSGW